MTHLIVFLWLQPEMDFSQDFWKWITLEKILEASLVIGVAVLLVYVTGRLLEMLSIRAPRARFFFKLLTPILRFGIWFTMTMLVVAIFAPSRETMLAVTASIGIALGLGAQDLIKNLIGGLMVLIDRPYQLGDRVKLGDAYGEIDHIGLYSTKLTTPDDTRVTIPNSQILNGVPWNSNSGVPDCQVVTDVFVPHHTDPATALEVGYEAAFSSPYTLLSKPVVVLLIEEVALNPYLKVRVKAYVYDHRYEPRFQSDITHRAKTEFLKRGIVFQ
ncbi:MAG: mechanosensitive ion channel [Acidobacteria bacterium]|nr:mechanosensitive ion channel [Acidobacteriota bacterium]